MSTITAPTARLRRSAHMADLTHPTYTLQVGATVRRTGDTNGAMELVSDPVTGAAGWVATEDLLPVRERTVACTVATIDSVGVTYTVESMTDGTYRVTAIGIAPAPRRTVPLDMANWTAAMDWCRDQVLRDLGEQV